MKRNAVVAIAVMLLSVQARADDLTERVKQHFQSGQKHYALGEFQQAADEFREAYRLHSEPALLFNIAQALRLSGKLEEARFQYSQYLLYRPDAANRPAVEKLLHELDATILERARRENEAARYADKYTEKEAPGFDADDAGLLKGGTLCVAPFLEDGLQGEPARAADAQERGKLQSALVDIAKSSSLLKGVIAIDYQAPACGIEDLACLASLGSQSQCTLLLAARATREENGFTLRARLVDAKGSKLLAKANQVIATGDESALAAWAEGQACRGLKVKCEGQAQLDADLPEMRILIDDQPLARKPSLAPGVPEELSLAAGIYRLRATIGPRQSREVLLPVRRHEPDTIYVRETRQGEVTVSLQSGLKPNEVPGPSESLAGQGTHRARIIGIVAASLGVVAEGAAIQQYERSQSLANGAADSYAASGYYKPADVAAVSSAKSAHTNSTILTVVGAGLIVAGAVLVVAF